MKFFVGLLLVLIDLSECANILGVFFLPSISHQIVFHTIVKDLAERGHQLTVLTTDLMKTDNPNITQIDLHGAYNTEWKDINQIELKLSKKEMFKKIVTVHSQVLDWELSQPEVKRLIENSSGQKFDLVLVEMITNYAVLAFGELFDCPVIEINSMDALNLNHKILGNDINPVIHPEFLLPFYHGKLTFMQRVKSLMLYIMEIFYYEPYLAKINENVVRKHFPNITTPLEEMKSRIQLMMTNVNPALNFIRPILPNTVQLGFMHIEKPKPLPRGELKSFLDNSKNGVVYMSLGSNAKSKDLKPEVTQMFLKVFSKLDLDVLWKFEVEGLFDKPDNVMLSKWLPQADMLAHPKLKLFITHGGHQSMEEAIDRTVPLIVIPFIVDQGANAARMKAKGIGYPLDIETLTEEKLLEAINEMRKPIYKENIRKLREQVYDQPLTSRERAVWWIESVIRHNGLEHLKYLGQSVPFYQKYWLDLIGVALLLILTVTKILRFLLKIIVAKTLQKLKTE